MAAARVVSGTLGLVYSITFRCPPARNMAPAVDRKPSLAQVIREPSDAIESTIGDADVVPLATDTAWLKLWGSDDVAVATFTSVRTPEDPMDNRCCSKAAPRSHGRSRR